MHLESLVTLKELLFSINGNVSKGYGFVTFAEIEAAQFAVNQHIMEIEVRV